MNNKNEIGGIAKHFAFVLRYIWTILLFVLRHDMAIVNQEKLARYNDIARV